MVTAATIAATTQQTLTVSSAGTPAHTHTIMLTPANLTTLRGGGMVDVTSSNDSQHTHVYRIICT
jgi:hypothetical protein